MNDISTGAHNDLARATDIARSMVKEYGMSEKIGHVYFAREKRSLYLDVNLDGACTYSEAMAEVIDSEVKTILAEQYDKALQILQDKKEVLSDAGKILLEQEKIDGEELKALADRISEM